MRATFSTAFAIALGACGGDTQVPSFPADYASSYVKVRNCRASGDHDLNHILVWADPVASEAYMKRDREFPVGAVVLKEEYEFSDDTCTGPIKQWTVIVRLSAGARLATLDWHWQKVDSSGHVVTDDEPRCYGCHATCGVAPAGYLGTCTVP